MVTANSAHATTIIYPTGVNATDVQNVQTAVNQGGTVLLKATNSSGKAQSFNFGTWPNTGTIPANSSVTLTANVVIEGETVGANRTTIQGGVVPFYESATAVKASIIGLKFVNPGGTAAAILRSNGITIQNNEVESPLPYEEYGFNQNLGFFVGGGAGNPTISGPVVITGNTVTGLDAPYEFGIQVNGVESPITIESNSIEIGNTSDPSAGTVDSEGIAVAGCPGSAVVAGNDVMVGTGVCYNGIVVRGPQTGAVTLLGNYVTIGESPYCYAGIGITGSTGTAEVLANFIDSESDFASGIYLDGSADSGTLTGATVSLNLIDIDTEMSAIELGGAVTKCSVSLNLIAGEAAYALSITNDGNPADIASSNSFLSDILLGFSASDATIFLDTNAVNNVVRTPYTKVINNGTGNQIAQ